MKTAIIGTGSVGKACAMATVLRGCTRELVLIDKNSSLAQAVATDIQYGAVLSPRIDLRAGTYADLKNADLVMVTAGVNEKTGGATDRSDPAGRLKLLAANKAIFADVIPQVVKHAPDAIILIVSDPPDPLADIARELAGHDRVLSAGTYLDTLRFKFHLAQQLTVDPAGIDALVIGEHGTSSVFLWSTAAAAGKLIDKSKFQKQVEESVKFANITIIEGNDASQFGIGMVCARIAEIILRDEQMVIPIGSYQKQFGVTISLPSLVGKQGVKQVFMPSMSAEESAALERCVEVLRQVLNKSTS